MNCARRRTLWKKRKSFCSTTPTIKNCSFLTCALSYGNEEMSYRRSKTVSTLRFNRCMPRLKTKTSLRRGLSTCSESLWTKSKLNLTHTKKLLTWNRVKLTKLVKSLAANEKYFAKTEKSLLSVKVRLPTWMKDWFRLSSTLSTRSLVGPSANTTRKSFLAKFKLLMKSCAPNTKVVLKLCWWPTTKNCEHFLPRISISINTITIRLFSKFKCFLGFWGFGVFSLQVRGWKANIYKMWF